MADDHERLGGKRLRGERCRDYLRVQVAEKQIQDILLGLRVTPVCKDLVALAQMQDESADVVNELSCIPRR